MAERRIFFLGVLGLGSGRGFVFPCVPVLSGRLFQDVPKSLKLHLGDTVHPFSLSFLGVCERHPAMDGAPQHAGNGFKLVVVRQLKIVCSISEAPVVFTQGHAEHSSIEEWPHRASKRVCE